MKSRIAVDPRAIAANRDDGGDRPVFAIARGDEDEFRPIAGDVIELPEGARLVYERDRYTSAVSVWIETSGEVAARIRPPAG